MRYTIAFRSGHVIEVDVEDGQGLTKEYSQALTELSTKSQVFYAYKGAMINLAEIIYVMPSSEVSCLR